MSGGSQFTSFGKKKNYIGSLWLDESCIEKSCAIPFCLFEWKKFQGKMQTRMDLSLVVQFKR